jgi:hypothetical protein
MKYVMMVIEFLFGCHHSNVSRVFTITGHTYRVCFDCGAKFDYSLKTMSSRPLNPSQVPVASRMPLKRAPIKGWPMLQERSSGRTARL